MANTSFSRRKPGIIGLESFRKYAVLVPLIKVEGVLYLIFERRSSKLRRQPGEICFPGGKLEEGETLKDCAIRETMEELLISKRQVKVFGPGDMYLSPFNLMIQPYIGTVKDYQETFSTDEVDEIIKVPLDYFRMNQPKTYTGKLVNEPPKDFPYEWIPGGTKYPWANSTHEILLYQYEQITIWGMTALMAKSAVELIDENLSLIML